jgi:hypothetical protein
MTRLPFYLLLLLTPLSASALWVGNCDKQPHPVTVVYPGEVVETTLAAGERRYFAGVPKEVHSGTDRALSLRLKDEYCIWGKNKLHLQRRSLGGSPRHR